jgi:outer membrane protein
MEHFQHTVRNSLLAVALFALPAGAQSSAPAKFAFIDSRVILDRAPGAGDVQAQLEKERIANMAKVQKMQDSLNTLVTAYQKDEPTLPDSQKVKRRDALESKRAEYEQRANDLDQEMQKRQSDLVQPIMAQIREVLDKLRAEEGYLFIFDVGQAGTIVAADKNLDITERVIARLKPVPVNVTKTDTTKAPAGTKPGPAGVTKKPPKPIP